MAVWKKVLTTDDVTDTGDTNIATDDLTLNSDTARYFYLGGEDGVSKTFHIAAELLNTNANGDLIQFRRDTTGEHKLFLSAAHGTFVGSLGGTNYKLPAATTSSDGKILVGTSNTSTAFETLEELAYPDGRCITHSQVDVWETLSPAGADSVLVYDDSQSKFVHMLIGNLGYLTSQVVRANLSFGRSDATSSAYMLRGINGVQHQTNFGYAAPRNGTLKKIGFSFEKEASGGNRKVKIYRNGTAIWESISVGGGTSGYKHESLFIPGNGSVISGASMDVSAGDQISIQITSASAGTTKNHQVILDIESTV